MLNEIFDSLKKGLKSLSGDYVASLGADLTRDWLKGQTSSKAQSVIAVDKLAEEGKIEEAYHTLLAMVRNSGDRDEEVLLQDSMAVYGQRAKFKVKEADVKSWFRFLARLPDEYINRLRHAHMTELDDNARLYKLARLMQLKNNKDRAAALAQAGIMRKSQISKFLEALATWDARFARTNRRLDSEYRRTRTEIRQAYEQRRDRGFGQMLWDVIRPRPFM